MLIAEIFKTIKDDYKKYGEVLQIEYFDDWINDTRFTFIIEGDNLVICIRNDIEKFEIGFLMEIEYILNFSIEDCIKTYNEYCYYSPNVYEEELNEY